MKDNETELGTAEIKYNEEGKIVSATFTPAVHTVNLSYNELNEVLKSRSLEAPAPRSSDDVRDFSQFVLADWFSSVGAVEIADPELGRIESQTLECELWDVEAPKLCKIRFYFKKF